MLEPPSSSTPPHVHINELPDETLLAVFQLLSPHALLTAELVCQRWRELATAHSQVLWRPFFEASPFARWWLPYQPSDDFIALKEEKAGRLTDAPVDYKWEFLSKSKSTDRWLKFASFRRVDRGLRDHSEDYGSVVKWSRNESISGQLGPNRLAVRALLVGGGGVGCSALSSELGKLFPGVCVSLDQEGGNAMNSPLTPIMFGHLPLELQIEVADICSVEGQSQMVRTELFESVRPTVVVAAFSLEDFRSFNKLSDAVLPSVRARFNDLPVLLVGTKLDKRESILVSEANDVGGRIFIKSASPTFQQGLALAHAVGAKNYVECSSWTGEGLSLVVREAAELGVRNMLQFFSRPDFANRPQWLVWTGQEGDQTEVHETTACHSCRVSPVVGNCYKCNSCPKHYLCQSCFQEKAHDHPFKLWHSKKKPALKRHVHRSTSFREGFRHRSSFIEEGNINGEQRKDSNEAQTLAEEEQHQKKVAEEVRREKEEIKKKGRESFRKTGLNENWKESVEDIFHMFSKSPEAKARPKRPLSLPEKGVNALSTTTEELQPRKKPKTEGQGQTK